MRALVSGSTGYLGGALVAALLAAGDEVHRVVRRPPATGEVGLDLKARRVDTSALPHGDLSEIDVVFNVSGEPLTLRRWGPEKLEAIRTSRILVTDLLARTLAQQETTPPPTLVSMSATGYYGSRGDEVLEEGSAGGEGFLAEVCRSWEAATGTAAQAGGRVVRVRTGVVLGEGGTLARLARIFRVGLGGRLGSGRQWTSWVSLADAIAGLLRCATDDGLSGPVNLCSPNPVRNEDLTKAISTAVHRPALLAFPRGPLVLALGARTTDDLVLASQRVLPRRLEGVGFSFSHPGLAECLAAGLGRR